MLIKIGFTCLFDTFSYRFIEIVKIIIKSISTSVPLTYTYVIMLLLLLSFKMISAVTTHTTQDYRNIVNEVCIIIAIIEHNNLNS